MKPISGWIEQFRVFWLARIRRLEKLLGEHGRMSEHDRTESGQTETIKFELDFKHSPKKVWRALTEPELLSKWLLPVVELKLEPGASFMFQAPPKPGWDGQVNCQVLEIDEGKKLRYRWRVGDLDTLLTFSVTPTDAGTHLSIVQTGFKPHQKQNFGGARYGWRMMTDRLSELLGELA
jgi:uncharacterized protein YndB with AHSA1/START domain